MKYTLITTLMCASTALTTHAATIVHFVDGTDADAAALTTNNAPANADYTVSSLAAVGFEGGASTTRTEFGAGNNIPGGTGEWLFQRASAVGGAASTASDYYGFTVTNNSGTGLTLDTFTFDAYSVTNDAGQSITAYFQLYYQIDGGGYTAIGTAQSTTSPNGVTANVSEFSPLLNGTVDLSSIGSINDGSQVEFLLSVYDNSGSNAKASFIQNIQLTTVTVPEPSSTALLGLGGLLLITRRRK